MSKPSPDDAADDTERDIADDPFLRAVNADLEKASKRSDNTLLVVLLGILLPSVFLYAKFGPRSVWPALLLAAAVIGVIVFTIVRVSQLKKAVAIKYGLVCPECGHQPGPGNVLSVATTLRCKKCRSVLPGRRAASSRASQE
jgi:hypothetical protein